MEFQKIFRELRGGTKQSPELAYSQGVIKDYEA